MKMLLAFVGLMFALCSADASRLNLYQIRTSVDLSQYEPDTIVVSTRELRLFYKTLSGHVVAYSVSVGREGFSWSGEATIKKKVPWPAWVATPEMLQRSPELPARIAGGPGNPLGAYALYLYQGEKDTLYRIHGTNNSKSIGKAVTSGCIRMRDQDVEELAAMVRIGTKVVVLLH